MSNKAIQPPDNGEISEESDILTTKELADYLRLNERTILKLAAHGEIPGARLGNQWRFRKNVIDTWLDDQMLGVRRHWSEQAESAPATFEFGESFRPEHVVASLQGNTISKVLAELCAKAQDLGLISDRTWFLGALLERENLLPSAVGEGVAFPHTLERHPEQVRIPFMLVGRSTEGVDFSASDRKRVSFVVLLGLRFQELHLPWLNRLSRLLQKPDVQRELMAAG
jgi:excisionase family DNA binding protein